MKGDCSPLPSVGTLPLQVTTACWKRLSLTSSLVLAVLQLEMPDLLQLHSWIKSKTAPFQADTYTSIANRVVTQPFPGDSALERRRRGEQHRATDPKCLEFPILKSASL